MSKYLQMNRLWFLAALELLLAMPSCTDSVHTVSQSKALRIPAMTSVDIVHATYDSTEVRWDSTKGILDIYDVRYDKVREAPMRTIRRLVWTPVKKVFSTQEYRNVNLDSARTITSTAATRTLYDFRNPPIPSELRPGTLSSHCDSSRYLMKYGISLPANEDQRNFLIAAGDRSKQHPQLPAYLLSVAENADSCDIRNLGEIGTPMSVWFAHSALPDHDGRVIFVLMHYPSGTYGSMAVNIWLVAE